MTTTIANNLDVFTAVLVDGYSATRASRNILHPIIGLNTFAVSLRPSALRSGSLKVLFTDEAIAGALLDALGEGVELTLDSSDRPAINMQFVATGDATLELDDETRDTWWVLFDWQETD